jgi:methylglutaconyl-CoA hydratase
MTSNEPAGASGHEVQQDGRVARVTLSRPAVHNAFDEHLIASLTATLTRLGDEPEVRAVVLTGAGKSFSAGADLDWMRRMAGYDDETNRADARRLELLLHTLDTLPKPTVALVNGAAMGGGVGLVAACDIAVAASHAVFALSEVRLGLIPAVIAPFVTRAIGERACRRYFLTAERFDAARARELGLVHEVAGADALEATLGSVIAELLAGGAEAQAEAKRLLPICRQLEGSLLAEATVAAIAARRASAEGREGIAAFLQKRQPAWRLG